MDGWMDARGRAKRIDDGFGVWAPCVAQCGGLAWGQAGGLWAPVVSLNVISLPTLEALGVVC